jgi:hypothetical protein
MPNEHRITLKADHQKSSIFNIEIKVAIFTYINGSIYDHVFNAQRSDGHFDNFTVVGQINRSRKPGSRAGIAGNGDILSAVDHFGNGLAGDAQVFAHQYQRGGVKDRGNIGRNVSFGK